MNGKALDLIGSLLKQVDASFNTLVNDICVMHSKTTTQASSQMQVSSHVLLPHTTKHSLSGRSQEIFQNKTNDNNRVLLTDSLIPKLENYSKHTTTTTTTTTKLEI
jgi:hypothetical protein